jgi:DNA repair exonuclease SbcCD ATPase subunit
VQGYNYEGDVILKCKNNIELLTQAYEEQKQAANDALILGEEEIWDGFITQTSKQSFWMDYDVSNSGKLEMAKSIRDNIDNAEALKKILEDSASYAHKFGFDTSGTWGETLKDAGIQISLFEQGTEKEIKIVQENLTKLSAYIRDKTSEINLATTTVQALLSGLIEENPNYQKLDKEIQDIVDRIIDTFGFEFYDRFRDKKDKTGALLRLIDKDILKPLSDPMTAKEIQSAFDKLLTLDSSELTVQEHTTEINRIFDVIKSAIPELDIEDLKVKLGFEIDLTTQKEALAKKIHENPIEMPVTTVLTPKQYEEQIQRANEIAEKAASELTPIEFSFVLSLSEEDFKKLDFSNIKQSVKALQDSLAETERIDAFTKIQQDLTESTEILTKALAEQEENKKLSLETYKALAQKGDEYKDIVDSENGELVLNAENAKKLREEKTDLAIQTAILNGASEEEIRLILDIQKGYEDAKTAVEQMKEAVDELTESLDIISSSMKILKETMADLDDGNGLKPETVKNLIKQYPELTGAVEQYLAGLSDEKDLRELIAQTLNDKIALEKESIYNSALGIANSTDALSNEVGMLTLRTDAISKSNQMAAIYSQNAVGAAANSVKAIAQENTEISKRNGLLEQGVTALSEVNGELSTQNDLLHEIPAEVPMPIAHNKEWTAENAEKAKKLWGIFPENLDISEEAVRKLAELYKVDLRNVTEFERAKSKVIAKVRDFYAMSGPGVSGKTTVEFLQAELDAMAEIHRNSAEDAKYYEDKRSQYQEYIDLLKEELELNYAITDIARKETDEVRKLKETWRNEEEIRNNDGNPHYGHIASLEIKIKHGYVDILNVKNSLDMLNINEMSALTDRLREAVDERETALESMSETQRKYGIDERYYLPHKEKFESEIQILKEEINLLNEKTKLQNIPVSTPGAPSAISNNAEKSAIDELVEYRQRLVEIGNAQRNSTWDVQHYAQEKSELQGKIELLEKELGLKQEIKMTSAAINNELTELYDNNLEKFADNESQKTEMLDGTLKQIEKINKTQRNSQSDVEYYEKQKASLMNETGVSMPIADNTSTLRRIQEIQAELDKINRTQRNSASDVQYYENRKNALNAEFNQLKQTQKATESATAAEKKRQETASKAPQNKAAHSPGFLPNLDLTELENETKTTEDLHKKAFDEQQKLLQHKRDMNMISEREYLEELDRLYKGFFADREEYIWEFRQYELEVYRLTNQLVERELSDLKHRLNMEKITLQEYYNEVERIMHDHYSGKIGFEQKEQQMLEELFSIKRQIFDEYIKTVEHAAGLLTHGDGTQKAQIGLYREIQDSILREIQYYQSLGLAENNKYLQELQKQWLEYQSKITDITKSIYDTAVNVALSVIDGEIKVFDSQIEVLDGEIKLLEEQKKALQEVNDEKEREITLEELRQNLTKARQQTMRVYREGVGWQYESDPFEIKKAQQALDKFKTDEAIRAIDGSIEAINAQKEAINEQIKALNDLKEQWNSVASDYELAQDKINVALVFGEDFEKKVLDDRIDYVKTFVSEYNREMDKLKTNDNRAASSFSGGGVPISNSNQQKIESAVQNTADKIASKVGSFVEKNIKSNKVESSGLHKVDLTKVWNDFHEAIANGTLVIGSCDPAYTIGNQVRSQQKFYQDNVVRTVNNNTTTSPVTNYNFNQGSIVIDEVADLSGFVDAVSSAVNLNM